MEVINAIAVINTLATQFSSKLVYLFCDSTTAVNIFQAGHRRDSWIQACARQLWLTCTTYDITLAVDHIVRKHLTSSADPLSHWHMGQHFKMAMSII